MMTEVLKMSLVLVTIVVVLGMMPWPDDGPMAFDQMWRAETGR